MRSFWPILLLACSSLSPAQQSAPAPTMPPQASQGDATVAVPGLTLGAMSSGAGETSNASAPLCSDRSDSKLPKCPTSEERHHAAREFREGVKLQKHQPREAYGHFESAAALAPDNLEYITTREVAKQKLVYQYLQRANMASASGKSLEAIAAFREALDVDPQNQFARQQLLGPLPRAFPSGETVAQEFLPDAIELRPQPGEHDFHLRGNARDIIPQVAQAYGITAVLDDSIVGRPLRFDLEQATWPMAMTAINRVSKTFWTPLSARQALFAADTDENRRSLERTASRTYYLPEASTPEALNEISSALRLLFDIKLVTIDHVANTLTVRTNARNLEAVSRFLQGLKEQQPEVVFDVKAYQVTLELDRALGSSVPTQFQVFNVQTQVQALINNPSTQSLVNQLISSGLINQANSTAIAALVALLAGGQNSVFSQPFAVFGGGITLSGLTVPAATSQLSRVLSRVQTLEEITLRASQGTAATMKVGERYPILNSIFSPIYSSSAISQVLGNQTYTAPFPSYSYQDLGFDLKATPVIHRDNSVTIKLEMQIRALGTQSDNGIPEITNREYSGYISSGDGEQIVLAGSLTRSEVRAIQGWPLLGALPGIGRAFSTESLVSTDDELLIILTPRVVIANPEAGVAVVLPNPSAK